ncbi:MAG: hypothetical protein Q8888_02570 [Vigna little leaf phytoplasma]|nr:hypothetical protein [Vigna little leaf phytoplasma]
MINPRDTMTYHPDMDYFPQFLTDVLKGQFIDYIVTYVPTTHQIKYKTSYAFDGKTIDAMYEYEKDRVIKKIQYQIDGKKIDFMNEYAFDTGKVMKHIRYTLITIRLLKNTTRPIFSLI